MKTFTNLKTLLGTAILAVLMTGCLDSEDPEFSIVTTGYILQKEDGEGGTRFSPYFGVRSYYMDDQISDIVIGKDGMPAALYCAKIPNTILWETSLDYNRSIPNGKYSVVATTKEGQSANQTYTFNIKEEKKLGNLNVTELTYDGSKLTANWDKVVNATAYMLSVIPEGKTADGASLGFRRAFGGFVQLGNGSADQMTGSVYLSTNNYEEGTLMRVAVTAVYAEAGTGTLMLESGFKTLQVGTKGWYTEN